MIKLKDDTWRIIETNAGTLKRVFATDDVTATHATCTFPGERCECTVNKPNWFQRLLGISFEDKMLVNVLNCSRWKEKKAQETEKITQRIIDRKKEFKEEDLQE